MKKAEHPQVYKNPEYYELAFSFRDIAHEVDVMEKCIRLYSRIPVRRVLELGCGPSPHMLEICTKGYEYIGLDLSEQMLVYARAKAAKAKISPTFIHGDMIHFTIPESVDFAFILLGSLYARDSEGLISHFESVAKAVSPGGLYLLDWCVEFGDPSGKSSSWTAENDRYEIESSYAVQRIDPGGQTFEELLTLKVREKDNPERVFEEKTTRKALFPQEFLLLIEKAGFEFLV